MMMESTKKYYDDELMMEKSRVWGNEGKYCWLALLLLLPLTGCHFFGTTAAAVVAAVQPAPRQ